MNITVKQGIDNCYLAHQYEHPGYEEIDALACERAMVEESR